ncbi:M4 family metallopeptidase [Streptomyces sp. DSM 42041]|uniref:Neutral metalloproteinase n=1 Tax=Streptomyces hazeniae TaxID=3075538 RepID=A0ABU2NKM3_9ACTN|nr:M4 family metallopeptidase [Streptomyces sp. DSM 42041]MDT0377473.1 M4 family metallopeptidase [Streptomyces sp. DSM 42041]
MNPHTDVHPPLPPRCGIVPPHLLDRLARSDDPVLAAPARRTLERDAAQRTRRHLVARATPAQPLPPRPAAEPAPRRAVYDAQNREELPGRRVRSEGEGPVRDASANRAYAALGATFALYLSAYGRDSIDGSGLPLDATVHYGEQYANAFWDGGRMVFGDGDGEVFRDFTLAVDVIGHELTHGVTQYTANLHYSGQSGALNESVSDVFGALIKQYEREETAADADWLIGAELFTDRVQGRALRSMKEPGTAYDDDVLGKDPQPGHMDDFVHTTDDNGGVHINSGIPNRAFQRFAVTLGGRAWERAGQVWYDTLTSGSLSPDADFADFAAATLAAAREQHGPGEVTKALSQAWTDVGVPVSG